MKKLLTGFAVAIVAVISFSSCTQYNYRHRDYSDERYERHHHHRGYDRDYDRDYDHDRDRGDRRDK
ncbi:hypothetical protein [Ferruginibacter sp.]|uniref:hypothetical protein n=1 Tax=Ferruginibacter sp. TaxID=1940288 RepID=UPI00265A5276|nr:hypothetical protein [Ferruginibacter sp.]